MSTLELERFESVPAGKGLRLFRLAGRWPQHGDAREPVTLVIESDRDTQELEALPEPGLSRDGSIRNVAFAGPEELLEPGAGYKLAVADLLYELPECEHVEAAEGPPARSSGERLTDRLAAMRAALPSRRSQRLPALPLSNIAAALPRPRLDRWDPDELRVMLAGCALGTATATAILVEIVP